ncbi:MAG: sortase [bacterium]|nr:sortase [bacterium]
MKRLPKLSFGIKLTVVYIMTAAFIMSPSVLADYRSRESAKDISDEVTLIAEEKHEPEIVNVGKPTEIYFARGTKTLAVSEGLFDSNSKTWIVKNGIVEWIKAQTNVTDSSVGHTILYGHNNVRVLGLTKKLVAGDFVIMKHEKAELIYKYTGDEFVLPNNLAILTAEKNNTLTLITCFGKNNEQRRLMHFDFKGMK